MQLPLRSYWELLAAHIAPQRGRFFLLAAAMLGAAGLQVANPQIMRFFIDTALTGGALERLLLAGGAFLAAALAQQGLAVATTYLGENVAWTATNALRAELAEHCLNLDMGFHNAHTPGEMIERIDGDVTELANFFSQFVVLIAGNALLLVGVLAALFVEDWRAGLAFTVFAVLALAALNRVRDIAVQNLKAFRQAVAEMYGFIEEQLAATEDVRASGAVDHSLREVYRLQNNIMYHDYRSNWKTWWIGNVTGIILTVGLILAVTTGSLLYTAGLATIGTVYLFVHYITLLEQPMWTLTHQIENFQTIGACVERLTELRKIRPVVEDRGAAAPSGASVQAAGPLPLAFEKVSFSYNTADPVLHEVSFSLAPGKALGLLGRTGSGKSTLTRLIFRLYDPTSGRITVDGQPLDALRLRALRGRIGVVTQDVQLFHASVRDNLSFFDRSISDERIRAALAELGLSDWLAGLPQGLDTLLETGGHSLSAGEAQLLAFARIFLRDPGLVILDEASSRLDPATEARIERAIDRLLEGRTALIVAHRLATVHRADEIMILEEGRVVEHGPRAALAADTGARFHHLLQTGLEEVLA